jgi:hypothetical protein
MIQTLRNLPLRDERVSELARLYGSQVPPRNNGTIQQYNMLCSGMFISLSLNWFSVLQWL